MRTAVFELHFEFAGERRIDKRIELRQICDPAGNLRLVVAQTRDVLSEARGLLRPRLTLPMSVFRISLPVRPTMVDLVVHEIAFRIAISFNLPIDHGGIDISFGEQPRAILVRALRVLNCLGVSGRLHIGHDDERRIRPTLHELPIHEIVLQDDMAPPQRHGVIGSGAQVQPILRGATKVRHAGVDHDECLGLTRHIDDQTRGIVVVRDGGIGSPLHVLRRMVDNLAPRPRLNVVKTRREMARALAYLIRGHDVRRAEQLKRHAGIRLHAPLASRAAPGEQAFGTVLLTYLHDVVRDSSIRLVPADPHPARIFAALGIRALHRELDAIRMVRRLDRRLTLAAMVAHGVEAGLVPFGSNYLAVLHVHPHTALHLAASATARSHFPDPSIACRCRPAVGKRRDRTNSRTNCGGSTRHGSKLSERPPCHGQLPHTPSFSRGFSLPLSMGSRRCIWK